MYGTKTRAASIRNAIPSSQSEMLHRLIFLVLAVTGLALAQQQQQPDNQTPALPSTPPGAPPDTGRTGPTSAQWKGLSVEEKLKYDGRHFFDVQNIVFAGIGAAFDQARSRPSEWGQGWDAYGERFASHLGSYVIQRSIMFPVQAIDHEDTRFFRSQRTSYQ